MTRTPPHRPRHVALAVDRRCAVVAVSAPTCRSSCSAKTLGRSDSRAWHSCSSESPLPATNCSSISKRAGCSPSPPGRTRPTTSSPPWRRRSRVAVRRGRPPRRGLASGLGSARPPQRAPAESAEAAIELACSLAGSTAIKEQTSFELRSLRTGGEMWEPAVVLLRSGRQRSGGRATPIVFPTPAMALAIVIGRRMRRHGPSRLVGRAGGWQPRRLRHLGRPAADRGDRRRTSTGSATCSSTPNASSNRSTPSTNSPGSGTGPNSTRTAATHLRPGRHRMPMTPPSPRPASNPARTRSSSA